LLVVVATAVIAVFFVCQHSRHVQIGYELARLQRERKALREVGRRLRFEVSHAAGHDALAEAAQRLGLDLEPPASGRRPH